MGLVPGHAKRKRNLADAKRNRQEAKLLKQDRLARRDEADQAKPWWQQRTVGRAITAAVRDHRNG
jgi:hypothetical protein